MSRLNSTLAATLNTRSSQCLRATAGRVLLFASVLLAAVGAPGVVLKAGPQGGPGQNGGASVNVAQSELLRRQTLVKEASEMIEQATQAVAKEDWQRARQMYEGAWRALPEAPATADWRQHALEGFASTSVELAKQQAAAAELDLARRTLDDVLADHVYPKHGPASTLRAQLDDPERYNPALTPEHLDNVEEVKRLLLMARGYEDLADWDRAEETLMRVLRIDPHNTAARRQMGSIQQQIRRYSESARDHTREHMLAEVDAQWETAVPASIDISGMFGVDGPPTAPTGIGLGIGAKMRRTIIPQVQLSQVTVREALDYLSAQAVALDAAEPDPDRRGISFIVSPSVPDDRVINLDLRQTPFEEVLRYITTQSGTSFRVEPFGIRITPAGEGGDSLVSRAFQVPPNFIQMQPIEAEADVFDPFGAVDAQPARGLSIRRMGAREFLEQQGITFPEGASANFDPSNSTLVVRNTQANLELIEFLVDQALGTSPRQVEIRMTMIQVRRNTLDELGLDWLLGPFDLGGGNFGSGGTLGPTDSSEFFGGFPLTSAPGTLPFGSNPVTAGLRSSGGLQRGQTLDGLLTTNPGGNPALQSGGVIEGIASRSPSVLSVAGGLTSPQYQVVLRALSQSRNADLAVAPAVITRSGQRALVEIVQEFPYPVEFEPPQIPQTIGGGIFGNDDFADDGPVNTTPFAPGGPSAFEVRRVGVILDVEPIISEDSTTIELSLAPEIVLFEGFIDYGSPVTLAAGGIGNQRVLAPQPYVQPVFRTNRLNTSVTIYDGATVVLGGVVLQNLRGIHDRVPIFGDVPLAGRLFQSKVNEDISLNVIFFVQVRVIDPGGRPVNR